MTNTQVKEAFCERELWRAGVLADRRLSRGALAVALCLSLHKNLRSGRCDPSLETIAKETAQSIRNTNYALADLERLGWIKRHVRPGTSTQYELRWGVQRVSPPYEDRGVKENERGAQFGAPGGAKIDAEGRSPLHPNLENIDLNNDGTVCADTHSTVIEVLDGKEGQPPTDIEIEAGFEEFWQQYPRAVDKGKARAQYRKAIKAGKATIMQIKHAVMIYAAARWEANQDHYTKTPANWLANECWGDDPHAHALGARNGFTRSSLAKMEESARRLREQQEEWIKKATGPPPPPPAPDPTWTKVCTALREKIGDQNYNRFFSHTAFEAIESGNVYLRTPAPYDARKINEDYGALLLELWKVHSEGVRAVTVVVGKSTMRRTGT